MIEFNALGRTIYYDERSTVFLFKPTSEDLESVNCLFRKSIKFYDLAEIDGINNSRLFSFLNDFCAKKVRSFSSLTMLAFMLKNRYASKKEKIK